MNEPRGTAMQIRPGLLDRLKINSGIRSDEAFARVVGVSRATLKRLKAGEEPTLRSVVGIADAFGLGLGEVIVRTDEVTEDADVEDVAVSA